MSEGIGISGNQGLGDPMTRRSGTQARREGFVPGVPIS